MRFTKLHIEDFRGIKELEIDFEPDLTVIVGRNGAGKTSILHALAMLMGLLSRIRNRKFHPSVLHRGISPRNIRLGAKAFTLDLCFEFYGADSNSVIQEEVGIRSEGEYVSSDFVNKHRLQSSLGICWGHSNFIYYRQQRGFEAATRYSDEEAGRELDPKAVQEQSLEEDLQAIGDLQAWWDQRDAQEARSVRDNKAPSYRDPQLQAIRSLIARIDSFSGVSFSSTSSPPGLRFIKAMDGAAVHVNHLSSGERSYIILLADLARRLQVVAPELPLEDIPAIVLIDEIELNLHPAWQSEILSTLVEVFGSCQFIATTHSPQVLSGVTNNQVRILDEDASSGRTKVTIPLSTKGRTSNYLLEGVLRTSERDPRISRLIEGFNDAIDQDDSRSAAERLTHIEDEIGDDTATILVLRKRLKRLRNK